MAIQVPDETENAVAPLLVRPGSIYDAPRQKLPGWTDVCVRCGMELRQMPGPCRRCGGVFFWLVEDHYDQ